MKKLESQQKAAMANQVPAANGPAPPAPANPYAVPNPGASSFNPGASSFTFRPNAAATSFTPNVSATSFTPSSAAFVPAGGNSDNKAMQEKAKRQHAALMEAQSLQKEEAERKQKEVEAAAKAKEEADRKTAEAAAAKAAEEAAAKVAQEAAAAKAAEEAAAKAVAEEARLVKVEADRKAKEEADRKAAEAAAAAKAKQEAAAKAAEAAAAKAEEEAAAAQEAATKAASKRKKNMLKNADARGDGMLSAFTDEPAPAPVIEAPKPAPEPEPEPEPEDVDWEDKADDAPLSLRPGSMAGGKNSSGLTNLTSSSVDDPNKRVYQRDFLTQFQKIFTDPPPNLPKVDIIIGTESAPTGGRDTGGDNHRFNRGTGGKGGDQGGGGNWQGGGGKGDDRGRGGMGGGRDDRGGGGGGRGGYEQPRGRDGGRGGGGGGRDDYNNRGGGGGRDHNRGGGRDQNRGGNRGGRRDHSRDGGGRVHVPTGPFKALEKSATSWQGSVATDELDAAMKKCRTVLNKLTPEKFERLVPQLFELAHEGEEVLHGLIRLIYSKAVTEDTFAEMYARTCRVLHENIVSAPAESGDDEARKKANSSFKRVLLTQCQVEFEKVSPDPADFETAEDHEAEMDKYRKRSAGNIKFVGELYKIELLTEKIMHQCIRELLGDIKNPAHHNVEALCKLLTTIGHKLDHPKAQSYMSQYFDRMKMMTEKGDNPLPSRLTFMIKDVLDLRRNRWRVKESQKQDGPKTLDQVHRDHAQKTQQQGGGGGKGGNRGGKGGKPSDPSRDYRVSRDTPAPGASYGGDGGGKGGGGGGGGGGNFRDAGRQQNIGGFGG